MACLTEPDEKIRLATLYQAKILRKNLDSELKARDAQLWIFLLLAKTPYAVSILDGWESKGSWGMMTRSSLITIYYYII